MPMSLTLFGPEEQKISYILYDPHTPNSLRFYAMETPRDSARVVDPIGPRDPYNRLARYDFTRRQCNGIEQAIDDVVINQVRSLSLYVYVSFKTNGFHRSMHPLCSNAS
jgi:phosphatidylinositol glycan class Q protein